MVHNVPMRLVLASASPARRATLIAAGITPIVRVSQVDRAPSDVVVGHDDGQPQQGWAGHEVGALAEAKCADVCDALCAPDSDSFDADPGALLVVGCDSMLEINGAMQGKPHTPEVARERIRAMRGTTATLWTGHSVALLTPRSSSDRAGSGSRTAAARLTRSASTQVHFGQITDAEIDAYVATGEPLRVAGSFTVDGLGGPFIDGVTGDYHSVVGISLPLLRSMATEMGIFWPDLWDTPRP